VSPNSLTSYVTQCNAAKFVKKLLGEKFVETVLQRLDRLMHDETRMTAAETLKVVYGLVQEMSNQFNLLVTRWLLSIFVSRWKGIR
jgi:hypothetical protein